MAASRFAPMLFIQMAPFSSGALSAGGDGARARLSFFLTREHKTYFHGEPGARCAQREKRTSHKRTHTHRPLKHTNCSQTPANRTTNTRAPARLLRHTHRDFPNKGSSAEWQGGRLKSAIGAIDTLGFEPQSRIFFSFFFAGRVSDVVRF